MFPLNSKPEARNCCLPVRLALQVISKSMTHQVREEVLTFRNKLRMLHVILNRFSAHVFKLTRMKKQILCLIMCIFFSLNLSAIYPSLGGDSVPVNDGPYISFVNDTLKVLRIENSRLTEEYLLPGSRSEVNISPGQSAGYSELLRVFSQKPDYRQSFKRVDSIVVITDVHGQYNQYLDELKANGIIDKNLKWKFGKGHLVYLGDAFDRGDRVTEVLWHLFSLEKQAAKAGGMVHFILGNHEEMVLDEDLRYLNQKYRNVEAISGLKYSELYSANSVLGKWLRSKPVMITINDIIFVHGGISPEMVYRNLNIRQINQIFADSIIGRDIWATGENEELVFLSGDKGPLWYRGYFTDLTFSESSLDSILTFYEKAHIVVGHSPHNEIKSLFNNKILGIDAGIMYNQPGAILIYKDGCFYKGSVTGRREKL